VPTALPGAIPPHLQQQTTVGGQPAEVVDAAKPPPNAAEINKAVENW